MGKPATPVHNGVSNCEGCHSTSSWASNGKPDHSGFGASTTCANCHNGSQASDKGPSHIPVGATNCFSCHSVSSWRPSKWNHTQTVVTAQCASCHTGRYPPADGKPGNHVPYQQVSVSASANCDACHKAGYGSWDPGRFHAYYNVTSQCSTCHTGGYLGAVGKPATPIHNGVTKCEDCHKTGSWDSNGKPDHSTYGSTTNCANCHNGSQAIGKGAQHIPVGLTNCWACHTVTAFKPSKWNHTQVVVTAQCATCHTGGYPPAEGKPGTHVPYQLIPPSASANCDACHKAGYNSWNPGRFHLYFNVSSLCSTCHTGSYLGAVGKPATPVHNGVTKCEDCHSTGSWATTGKPDHSGFGATTNCGGCHNGSQAIGKGANHIPVGNTNCWACHTVTAFKPSKWNHTQTVVTAQCASCHTGRYPPADGKPTNHVPYQQIAVMASANCDACHKGGYASWNPGRIHAYYSLSTQCGTCHTGSYLGAVGKPATPVHNGVSVCEDCHRSTSSWNNVQYRHSATDQIGSGTCDNCHNGTVARGKPATHIPVTVPTAKCDACHRSQVSFGTSVTMNHSAVASQTCKGCHISSYVSQGLQAKPTNHIPETQLLNGAAMDCKACHNSTASWGTMRMNHNGSLGGGAGWCKACHASGTSYLGNMERKSLTHEAKGKTPLDCSESGCHKPLGGKGSTYTEWD
ncbi:cytochrome c3 family protein [Ideonella alba]|uniref:cytochrome c3 family protein n=1 Tax=Ideonella alba TaxID=2824118 RepID=UPI002872E47C|nr:cytochrome c3 family protein [Ideonella alba]